MVDIDKVRCKIRSMQEITRQNYIAKRKEFEEYKVNQEDTYDFVKYVQTGCDAAELCGEVLAYEEVLREINLFILGDMTTNE